MANQDPKLANLLRWSIEASNPSDSNAPSENAPAAEPSSAPTDTSTPAAAGAPPLRGANAEALASLLGAGGASDAELMKRAMAAAQDAGQPLEARVAALDDLEQLLESLDNAADLTPLGLWAPLLNLLQDPAAAVRRMAAWCVGTAVQNSRASQERARAGGALPLLVRMARGEGEGGEEREKVRRKARYAVSSLVRNFQPGVDEVLGLLGAPDDKVDAGDMDSIDKLIERLEG